MGMLPPAKSRERRLIGNKLIPITKTHPHSRENPWTTIKETAERQI
jgi:hypothetical protein